MREHYFSSCWGTLLQILHQCCGSLCYCNTSNSIFLQNWQLTRHFISILTLFDSSLQIRVTNVPFPTTTLFFFYANEQLSLTYSWHLTRLCRTFRVRRAGPTQERWHTVFVILKHPFKLQHIFSHAQNFLFLDKSFSFSLSCTRTHTYTHTKQKHLLVLTEAYERLSCLSGFFITKCNKAKEITAAPVRALLEQLLYFLHWYL